MYRLAAAPGAVDTVPFGAFRRSLIERIGPFDETLLTNEDYEFNTRIRQRGGTVWLDPAIRSVYFARPDLAALARQYFRYGFWKFRMLQRYPGTVRWRQALPPLFVASLVALGCARHCSGARLGCCLAWKLGSMPWLLLAAGSLAALQRRQLFLLPGLPLAIARHAFQLGWGLPGQYGKIVSDNEAKIQVWQSLFIVGRSRFYRDSCAGQLCVAVGNWSIPRILPPVRLLDDRFWP